MKNKLYILLFLAFLFSGTTLWAQQKATPKAGGEPEKKLEAILRQLTDSDKDQFMKAFWLELVTMKKEKQQVLTEFLLEWLWVACGKEQAMERIRYWASSYCLPFA